MRTRRLPPLLALLLLASQAGASGVGLVFREASRAEIAASYDDDGGGGVQEGPSRSRAFLLSLLLPGLGQRANGSELRSRAFFGTEAAIWTAFVVFKVQEHNRTGDFEEYARAYAEVSPGGKETEYYRILTIYDNVDQYNESVRIEGRALFPIADFPEDVRDRYYAEHAYGPDEFFRWRTRQARLDYRLIRNDALDSGRRADYMLVAAIVNHAVSAVEAARFAGHWGSVSRAAAHIRAGASGAGEPPSLRLGVGMRF